MTHVYVAIRYAECQSRPERLLPAGCGCDESVCEYSRVWGGFELKVLLELPASHQIAAEADASRVRTFRHWQSREIEGGRQPARGPACPVCPEAPWGGPGPDPAAEVPRSGTDPSVPQPARLYSVSALQVLLVSA